MESDTAATGSHVQRAELRLALVCYGGVSLAIYMHGVTKELHKLVRAGRAFDALGDLDGQNPFAAGDGVTDTEAAYFEALRDLARDGRRLSVSIDIIAGTSAGGINGVVLAKAIARDAPQEALKRLWIDEGDLKTLLRAPAIGGLRTRAVLAIVRQLTRLNQPTSPLRGEHMSKLLVGALADMDRGPEEATLLPQGGSLQLLVTTTDMHGFEVLVPSGAGGASQRDRYHAQVLEFRARNGNTVDFGPGATPALAFSARATSCFPGAFAPVSLGSFHEESGVAVAARGDLFRFQYSEHGQRAEDAWLVDGGVLDNAPFDLVIDAIGRRRARSEVLRRLVYIQPDPGRDLYSDAPGQGAREAPGWLAGLWRTAAGVKGSHPILLELLKLRDMNWRISQIGAIAESQMTQVLAVIEAAIAGAAQSGAQRDQTVDAIDSKDHVQAVSDEMHDRARAELGPTWATYQRLKVEAAGRRLADEVAHRFVFPPDSGRSSFVRAAIAAWARSRPEWQDPDPTRLVSLLGPVDVPYRERRLMFLLAGVNGLYGQGGSTAGPPREDLDRLKGQAWSLLEDLQRIPRQVVASVPDEVVAFLGAADLDRRLLDRPEDFAAEHAEHFTRLFESYREALVRDLGDGSTPLWTIFQRETAAWDDAHRMQLLGRYLGFPLWDGIIFPTISLSELPQFTPIGVSQFSPLTASVLRTPEGGKLKGVSLHHFGAFLDSAWRENDYLWGRLDAAELILRTLDETRTSSPAEPGDQLTPQPAATALRAAGGSHLVAALRSVLATEQDLAGIAELRRALAAEVEALAGLSPPGTP